MRPFAFALRALSLRIAGLTAVSAGFLACSGTALPDATLDGAARNDRQDGEAAADGNPVLDDASAAPDSTAADDATPSAGDATASSDATEDATVPPSDAGDAAAVADAADAASVADAADATSLADAADAGPRHLTDAGPTSGMVTAYLDNPAHTSSSLDPSLAPPLAAIWSFNPPPGVTISYPLIAGGRVYFVYGSTSSGSTQQLIAVNEHTGVKIWGPVDLGAYILEGQAYDGERIFTVDETGLVRSFASASGAPGWTKNLSSNSAAQPTAYGGLVYVATNEALTALDEETGQVTWTAPLDNVDPTTPAVTDDGVFVSAACGDLSAFDRSTGSLLWHHLSTCGEFAGLPMVFDGRVYLDETDPGQEQVDMFDVRTGGLVASLPCFIPPAFDEGQAYCNLRTPLAAFDLTTGAQAWTFSGDRQLNRSPFAAAGTVYVASDTGMMFGVDQATGAQVWSTEVDGLGASSYTVGGEGILLTQLYASSGVMAYAHVDAPHAGD